MAIGDIQIFDEAAFGYPGSQKLNVASGAVASINAGEPVAVALGAAVVTALATNKPVVGTDFLAGVAETTSDDTAALAGTVQVLKLVSGVSYLISPKVAATFDTQAKYDALVGSRVLLDLTAGVYTILAADGATYGCVILPLNILKHPGKVRFAFRNALNFVS